MWSTSSVLNLSPSKILGMTAGRVLPDPTSPTRISTGVHEDMRLIHVKKPEKTEYKSANYLQGSNTRSTSTNPAISTRSSHEPLCSPLDFTHRTSSPLSSIEPADLELTSYNCFPSFNGRKQNVRKITTDGSHKRV